MGQFTTSSTLTRITPASLSREAMVEAQRLAQRLRESVHEILKAVPPEAQTAAGLARHLGVERSTCTRLISAISGPIGPEVLVETPGPRALRALALSIQRAGIAEGMRLEAAALQLEQFFASIGGKQRGFARLLAGGVVATDDPAGTTTALTDSVHDSEAARLFDNARQIVGRSSDVQIHLILNGPSTTKPGYLDTVNVRGYVGLRANAIAPPLVINGYRVQDVPPQTRVKFATLDQGHVDGVNTDILLPRFCSEPLPNIESRTHDDRVSFFVEHARNNGMGIPADIIFGEQMTGGAPFFASGAQNVPENLRARLIEAFAFMNYPTRALIFDIYLHSELAGCIPGLDKHLWLDNVVQMKADRWATRIHPDPDLMLLGRGLGKAASRFYPRHTELTTEAFRRFGQNPDDYIGYRCELEYPVWRLGYRMFFEYR